MSKNTRWTEKSKTRENKSVYKSGGKSRLDALKLSRPEHAKKVVALLKKRKEDRKKETPMTEVTGDPSMKWNKKQLLGYASQLDTTVEVPKNWTKKEILDYIEEYVGG